MRYVVVTGGVMSGLGKGIVSASIGKILQSYGFKVRMIKMDGYLNVDPGTLNPYEHGEVYVLEDGTETDLDLGHYERFLNLNLDKDSSVTNGKIYKNVIENERKGVYLGKTVQIIPHVTNEIIKNIIDGRYLFSWNKIPGDDNEKLVNFLNRKFGLDRIKPENIKKSGDNTINVSDEKNNYNIKLNDEKTKANLEINDSRTYEFIVKTENSDLNIYYCNEDVIIVEVGGTVGDMENMTFLEALRQLAIKEYVVFVHLSYVPVSSGNEQKTKPTQHSIRNLLQLGIYPDILIGRCETDLQESTKNKISLFGGVEKECVISDPDVEIYEIPLLFDRQNLGNILMNKLGMEISEEMRHNKFNSLHKWKNLVENLKNKNDGTIPTIKIGIVGKYAHLEDAYLSIKEALRHCQMNFPSKITISLEIVESETENLEEKLTKFDGIIVPGGFGTRGMEEKIKAINFCRINKVPFLGICMGFQLAVIEFARNACGIENANSSEFDNDCKNPVIDLMLTQREIKEMGGTMRLGNYRCIIEKGSLAENIYKKKEILRRHRHRYEVNLKYKEILEKNGLFFSGMSPDKKLMEILELKGKDFFIATQYHPEFSSRPEKPEELFMGLVEACVKMKQK